MEMNNEELVQSVPIVGSNSVVIGGNQGIGAAIASRLGKLGSNVVIAGRNPETLHTTVDTLRSEGSVASSYSMDVSDTDSTVRVCQRIVDEVGTPRLVVNAAGGALKKNAFDVTADDWNTIFDTHLRGTFFVSQTFARSMASEGYGKFINLSSAWATSVAPLRSVYASAKAGVSHLTAALAVEWAPLGIRVNAVAPTATKTPRVLARHRESPDSVAYSVDRIPLGRIAELEDVVEAVIFLGSDVSDFVTGHTLYVDGGWHYAR